MTSAPIEVWYLQHDFDGADAYLPQCAALLCPVEREKYLRLRLPADQKSFLLSHALLRAQLSHVSGIAPEEWKFRYGEKGRLELAMNTDATPPGFNLSHTRAVSACIVTPGLAAAGVDVEDIRRRVDVLRLAARFFADTELRDIERWTDPLQRSERFMQYWTLKEACLKALGTGFSLPPDSCVFQIKVDGEVKAGFGGALQDDPAHWQFHSWKLPCDHIVSAAVRRPDAEPLVLRLVEWRPDRF